ncbi:MAG: ornithine carbamoyltransferase [Candidatus Omnitrophica bacterium]|nr:ornithine carbamoyltransferase [Candidatus Omnitrophota bacterium]
MKDLISVKLIPDKEAGEIFALTGRLKKNPRAYNKALAGKTLALIFQKPSNRTRVSFEVGMYQLGGHTIYLGPEEINLGVREAIKDVARTLSRYVDGIVLRTFAHKNVLEMAAFSQIPVINGLSDYSHPCQALADLYTVKERFGRLKGIRLAYVGDGNNVCNSLIYACVKLGLNIRVASPAGYEPDAQVVREARALAFAKGSEFGISHDPFKAVSGADVVYTDVWASMGQEKEAKIRARAFRDFQINARLMKKAGGRALVMHCLPAHRGQEITDEVLDGARAIVFDQAENRMHVQKAVLIRLLGRRA